jgi:hypothetical protein
LKFRDFSNANLWLQPKFTGFNEGMAISVKKKHLHTGRKSIFTREEKASSHGKKKHLCPINKNLILFPNLVCAKGLKWRLFE